MHRVLSFSLMALGASAAPIAQRQDKNWQVTSFSSYVAAHSIAQITSFSVTIPETNETVDCGNVIGAASGPTPYLMSIIDSPCGAGLNYTFQQVKDYAVELSVQSAAGVVATYTSPPNEVVFRSTGTTPLDVETAYIGPHDFELLATSGNV